MMTNRRGRQILASYGGLPERWPDDEREDLQRLLGADTELQSLQRQVLQLDKQLTELFVGDESAACEPLARKILANLPERSAATSPRQRSPVGATGSKRILSSFDWLTPARSMAAATVVILALVGMIQFGNRQADSELQWANSEDEWLLMADALDNSPDMELLAVWEPELSEDDLDML